MIAMAGAGQGMASSPHAATNHLWDLIQQGEWVGKRGDVDLPGDPEETIRLEAQGDFCLSTNLKHEFKTRVIVIHYYFAIHFL